MPEVVPSDVDVEADADVGSEDVLSTDAGWGRWGWAHAVLIGGAVLAGIVLRFVTTSPLWLDESLSVNIARLPWDQLHEALRHDGHPPLYYVLLHGWMAAFGEGAFAVRAFSGLWSLALLPLLFVAVRRVAGTRPAWYGVALLALSPYAIRYATETRMYAMVSVLALVGWLLVDDALRRPSGPRLVGIAAVTGLLLWSHYWAMWFLAAAFAGLAVHAWRAHRAGRSDDLAASVRILVAFVVGALLFLPWVPTLLYQGAHTGTPWARPVRPTEMVANTLADLGGGPQPESVVLGWSLAVIMLVGLFGRARDRFHIDLDLHTRPVARPFAILVAGTLGIACAVGYATGATYATRYAAVIFPFLLVLVALGVDQFRSRPVALGVLAFFLLLGGIGGVRNVVTDRSDAQRNADAIVEAGRPGDVVVYCPDQAGPSTDRLLPAGFDQVTYPDLAPPELVDWVDYKARLNAADVDEVADRIVERAGDRRIFLVWSDNYETHRAICPDLYHALATHRAPTDLTQATEAYERASVAEFPPPP